MVDYTKLRKGGKGGKPPEDKTPADAAKAGTPAPDTARPAAIGFGASKMAAPEPAQGTGAAKPDESGGKVLACSFGKPKDAEPVAPAAAAPVEAAQAPAAPAPPLLEQMKGKIKSLETEVAGLKRTVDGLLEGLKALRVGTTEPEVRVGVEELVFRVQDLEHSLENVDETAKAAKETADGTNAMMEQVTGRVMPAVEFVDQYGEQVASLADNGFVLESCLNNDFSKAMRIIGPGKVKAALEHIAQSNDEETAELGERALDGTSELAVAFQKAAVLWALSQGDPEDAQAAMGRVIEVLGRDVAEETAVLWAVSKETRDEITAALDTVNGFFGHESVQERLVALSASPDEAKADAVREAIAKVTG